MSEKNGRPSHRDRVREIWRSTQDWAWRNLPPGTRLIAGLLIMTGGFFGFLPVLGFWMIPLGFAVAAIDVVLLWRKLTGRNGHADTEAKEEERED